MFAPPFAQAAGGPSDSEFALILMAVVGLICVVSRLAINLVFLTTLKKLLEQCARHNRRIEPGQVFLNLIPFFGAIWMFFTVTRVSQTLRDEFDERGIDVPGDYGSQMGISFAALTLSWLIPYVGPLFAVVGFGLWIAYWVKMAEYSRTLRDGASFSEERGEYRRRQDERRESDRRRRRRDDDRDDDDDRPSRRRRYED